MGNEDSVLVMQSQDNFKIRTLCQNRKECGTRKFKGEAAAEGWPTRQTTPAK